MKILSIFVAFLKTMNFKLFQVFRLLTLSGNIRWTTYRIQLNGSKVITGRLVLALKFKLKILIQVWTWNPFRLFFRGKKTKSSTDIIWFTSCMARKQNNSQKSYHQTKISSKRTHEYCHILIFHLFPDHFRLLNYFLILL